jgi:hypothetical protein
VRVFHIHMGRFSEFKFKGADAILIEVDAAGLKTLRGMIANLASGSEDHASFHSLPGTKAYRGLRLNAEVALHDSGVRELEPSHFVWRLSKDGWDDRAAQLLGLGRGGAGHQYLEEAPNGFQIIVATGEYPPEWWSSWFGE